MCGLQNEIIQKKLPAEEELSLDKAFKMAISRELAAQQSVNLQKAVETRHETSIDRQTNAMRVTQRPLQKSQGGKHVEHGTRKSRIQLGNNTPRKPRWRCGKPNHNQAVCYFRQKECWKCQKKGYTANQCKGSAARAQYLRDEEDGSDSKLVGHEQSIRSSYETICKIQLWMVPVQLNDK